MNRYHRVMELFWLTAAIVSLVMVGYLMYHQGMTADTWPFMLVPVGTAAMWALRRWMRKRMEKKKP